VPVAPESITAGECYVTSTGRVRRVAHLLPDGRVLFATRLRLQGQTASWKDGIQTLAVFAASLERLVPWDWRPEQGET
jgi:hypothetical protein